MGGSFQFQLSRHDTRVLGGPECAKTTAKEYSVCNTNAQVDKINSGPTIVLSVGVYVRIRGDSGQVGNQEWAQFSTVLQ